MSLHKIRICFLGTPEFAADHLQALLNQDNYEVVGVITQPDRAAGRKMQLTPSAVKTLALKNNLTVLTPANLRKEPEVFEQIKSWQADVAVVVAFGQILSEEFLNSFKFGAVNVHGSLLPLYRGAAPIQRALQNGDSVTGVSLQKMVFKLDAGPVIAERRIDLDLKINATELYKKLSILGCELLKTELFGYLENKIIPIPQDESKVTIAQKISKEESLLDLNLSAVNIHNKVRAFTMGPGTYLNFQGKRLKIHSTEVVDAQVIAKIQIGHIVEMNSEQLIIQCGVGTLSLLEVQPESKSKMSIRDYLKSSVLKKGDSFL